MSAIGAGSVAIDRLPPPELIARFRADLDGLWSGEGPLGLAVSGGPDSIALLLLAHAAMPGRIAAATVDHGLRPESAGEAAMVHELCKELGVPHQILNVDVACGNVQSEARTARYSALAQWMSDLEITALATAHHADDQAETLLMRLNRGSGLPGLAGVRASGFVPGTGLPLVRPLLGWRKAELEDMLQSAKIDYVEDPSNVDDRFDRARFRKAIDAADWLDVEAIARSAALLDEAHQALDQWTDLVWTSHTVSRPGEIALANTDDLPRNIRIRLLSRAIAELGGDPRGSQVAELLDALDTGKKRNLAGVIAVPSAGGWVLRREPPRRQ